MNWIRITILSAVLILGLGLRSGIELYQLTKSPIQNQSGWVLQVPSGSHFQGVVDDLKWLGLARSSWQWRAVGRFLAPEIKAGEYRVNRGESVGGWIEQLRLGQVERHSFTIVEGWTVDRLRAELLADPKLQSETGDWSNQELMTFLACDGCPAEGQFLPETYLYERGDSDVELLRRAHLALREALNQAYALTDLDGPLEQAEDLLILASLIERETALAEERGQIAGVFMRRLEKGMRLQTDPTVIYGLGEAYNGRLTRQDLRTDHPWNTYTRYGLPATPIALPSRASLLAAAQPDEGDALYFVAKGDGSHVFSVTLDDHNRAVDRYIRGLER